MRTDGCAVDLRESRSPIRTTSSYQRFDPIEADHGVDGIGRRFLTQRLLMSKKETFRVVVGVGDGNFILKDFTSVEPLLRAYEQIGIDDCSTDLALRGMPVFRGLVGPMPEGKTTVRYETPEIFERLTKDWAQAKPKRRRRRTSKPEGMESAPVDAALAGGTPSA
jgi:hypothetical protein